MELFCHHDETERKFMCQLQSDRNNKESKKIVSDKELITKFSDSLHVPSNVTGKNTNSAFNSVIQRLSKSAKKSLVN